jgi:hypothetical protein
MASEEQARHHNTDGMREFTCVANLLRSDGCAPSQAWSRDLPLAGAPPPLLAAQEAPAPSSVLLHLQVH